MEIQTCFSNVATWHLPDDSALVVTSSQEVAMMNSFCKRASQNARRKANTTVMLLEHFPKVYNFSQIFFFKGNNFITTAVRTSNPTQCIQFILFIILYDWLVREADNHTALYETIV
jgi:hypothetical protein